MTKAVTMQDKAEKPLSELRALARKALAGGDLDAAERHLGDAFEIDEHDAAAMTIMSDVWKERGDEMQATGYAVLAINTDNENMEAKRKFLHLAANMSFTHHNPKVESALLACLETEGLEFGGANVLWGNALLINPEFSALFAQVMRKRLLPFRSNPFNEVTDFKPLLTPFFLRGLAEIVVCFLPFEQFITHLRGFLLEQVEVSQRKISEDDFTALLRAMARYSFHTDYILDVSDKEQKKIDSLRRKVEGGETDAQDVALLACYVPLYTLENATAIEGKFAKDEGGMGAIVGEQVTEYNTLKKRADGIEAATSIDDEISEKVKGMYESFPYPRWRELEETQFNWRVWEKDALAKSGAQGLVAGCGTGRESAQLAAAFPEAEILAVDITCASLAYAMEKSEKYGLKNLTYRQADILKLGDLGKEFDYIHSVGVLHHMNDPEKGWEILTGLLKPGGIMHIGLYGETPRRAIVEARRAVAGGKYPPTPEGMRRFRKDSAKLLKPDSLATLLKARDYYFLNMYSDLLFHVHEDRFTIPRIRAALEKLGLVFKGFKLPDAVLARYAEMFPDDTQGLSFDNWEAFEKNYPDTFIHSYKFWCVKPE